MRHHGETQMLLQGRDEQMIYRHNCTQFPVLQKYIYDGLHICLCCNFKYLITK